MWGFWQGFAGQKVKEPGAGGGYKLLVHKTRIHVNYHGNFAFIHVLPLISQLKARAKIKGTKENHLTGLWSQTAKKKKDEKRYIPKCKIIH